MVLLCPVELRRDMRQATTGRDRAEVGRVGIRRVSKTPAKHERLQDQRKRGDYAGADEE
jgi:hypothetical protein